MWRDRCPSLFGLHGVHEFPLTKAFVVVLLQISNEEELGVTTHLLRNPFHLVVRYAM